MIVFETILLMLAAAVLLLALTRQLKPYAGKPHVRFCAGGVR